jgi:hypothetical protein
MSSIMEASVRFMARVDGVSGEANLRLSSQKAMWKKDFAHRPIEPASIVPLLRDRHGERTGIMKPD